MVDLTRGCPALDYDVSLEQDGKVSCCCYTYDYKFNRLKDSQNWRSIQKTIFDNNSWPRPCSQCKDQEEKIGSSMRVDYLNRFPDYNPLTTDLSIKKAIISFSNLCNYACIICNPSSSSKIYDMSTRLDRSPSNWDRKWERNLSAERETLNEILDYADELTMITFSGGEPFLIKEYYSVLDKLPDNCSVQIITNVSVYNPEFISRLKKFKRIELCLSLDGYGKINEAIRLNSNWENIEKNIRKIKNKLKNAALKLTPTWTNFSIYHWKPLIKWAMRNGIDVRDSWRNIIHQPSHFKIGYMSNKGKNKIIKELTRYDLHRFFQNYIYEDLKLNNDIINDLLILQEVGKQNGFDYQKLFPHIYNKDFLKYEKNINIGL